MEVHNLSASQLADKLGIQRSGLSHILSGRNRPGLDFAIKVLEKFPDINPDWLLLGKGVMLRKDSSLQPKPEPSGKSSNHADSSPVDLFTELTQSMVDLKKNHVIKEEKNRVENLQRNNDHESVVAKQVNDNAPEQNLPNVPSLSTDLTTNAKVEKIILVYSNGQFELLSPKI